ncbi:hypothetical protein GCK32_021667, partial [Trichostrongylus colubriformis]
AHYAIKCKDLRANVRNCSMPSYMPSSKNNSMVNVKQSKSDCGDSEAQMPTNRT